MKTQSTAFVLLWSTLNWWSNWRRKIATCFWELEWRWLRLLTRLWCTNNWGILSSSNRLYNKHTCQRVLLTFNFFFCLFYDDADTLATIYNTSHLSRDSFCQVNRRRSVGSRWFLFTVKCDSTLCWSRWGVGAGVYVYVALLISPRHLYELLGDGRFSSVVFASSSRFFAYSILITTFIAPLYFFRTCREKRTRYLAIIARKVSSITLTFAIKIWFVLRFLLIFIWCFVLSTTFGWWITPLMGTIHSILNSVGAFDRAVKGPSIIQIRLHFSSIFHAIHRPSYLPKTWPRIPIRSPTKTKAFPTKITITTLENRWYGAQPTRTQTILAIFLRHRKNCYVGIYPNRKHFRYQFMTILMEMIFIIYSWILTKINNHLIYCHTTMSIAIRCDTIAESFQQIIHWPSNGWQHPSEFMWLTACRWEFE